MSLISNWAARDKLLVRVNLFPWRVRILEEEKRQSPSIPDLSKFFVFNPLHSLRFPAYNLMHIKKKDLDGILNDDASSVFQDDEILRSLKTTILIFHPLISIFIAILLLSIRQFRYLITRNQARLRSN